MQGTLCLRFIVMRYFLDINSYSDVVENIRSWDQSSNIASTVCDFGKVILSLLICKMGIISTLQEYSKE